MGVGVDPSMVGRSDWGTTCHEDAASPTLYSPLTGLDAWWRGGGAGYSLQMRGLVPESGTHLAQAEREAEPFPFRKSDGCLLVTGGHCEWAGTRGQRNEAV